MLPDRVKNEIECVKVGMCVLWAWEHPSKFIHKIRCRSVGFHLIFIQRAAISCRVCQHIYPKLNKDFGWRRGLTCELETWLLCVGTCVYARQPQASTHSKTVILLSHLSVCESWLFSRGGRDTTWKGKHNFLHGWLSWNPFSFRHVN
jgi:hypothetical protein